MFLRLNNLTAPLRVWLAGLVLLCCGCAQEMANQPRVDVMEPSAFEFETPANRTPIPGTIARGQRWQKTPELTGRTDSGLVQKIPLTVDDALLNRGREKFEIFCKHCHGMAGFGDGMVVQRGFPAPPSYHTDRLRQAPDGQLFLTITDGVGRMPWFRDRIVPEDRWAIVAYLRALQLSQNSNSQDLPASDREQLK
jgi:mono/diheme cytochrome c family protein